MIAMPESDPLEELRGKIDEIESREAPLKARASRACDEIVGEVREFRRERESSKVIRLPARLAPPAPEDDDG